MLISAFKKLAAFSLVALVQGAQEWPVPTFTPEDLQRGLKDKLLHETLTSTGLLAIRIPTSERNDLLEGICHCREDLGPEIHGGDKILLADGLTTRSTIATATVGTDHPLSLPEKDINEKCGDDTFRSMERARDYVSQAASDLFVPALDRLIREALGTASDNSILTTRNGHSYTTISEIVQDSVNLEHFHSYSKRYSTNAGEKTPVDQALDWHTDGGLLLAFLPAKSCHDHQDRDDSFRLKLHGSTTEVQASFPENQDGEVIVAIMLGAGAESWLHTPASLKLRATRHAVKMSGGDERAWYGMMLQVPAESIVQTVPEALTFAELKKSSVHSGGRRFGDDKSHPDSVVVGSSVGLPSANNYSTPFRRRLQHVGGPEDCNNVNSFFCWLSCIDLPDSEKTVDEHLTGGESLYCLDPFVLASQKDLKAAVAACSDSTGTAGGIHQSGCANHWFRNTEGVQTYLEADDYTSDLLEERYCYGASGMYMRGFEWESKTCVVYLFSSWVVTTRGALIGACFGTIAFGMLVEFIIRQRREILRKFENGKTKMAYAALLYALQLTTSYLVMLIIMTYSGPLFCSVIVGLVCGHVLSNWTDLTGEKESGEASLEGSTPCCQNVVVDNPLKQKPKTAPDGNEKESNNSTIAIDCCGNA